MTAKQSIVEKMLRVQLVPAVQVTGHTRSLQLLDRLADLNYRRFRLALASA